jgi:hypothetical protein
MSTTLFIPSTISTWTNLDLNIINSLNISCLNLRLNKILLNLRNIMVNGPENYKYIMLDYDINAAH